MKRLGFIIAIFLLALIANAQAVWWNNSFGYCLEVNLNNTIYGPYDEAIDVQINFSDKTRPHNSSLVLIDQPCNSGGNPLLLQLWNQSAYANGTLNRTNIITTGINYSKGVGAAYSLYYDPIPQNRSYDTISWHSDFENQTIGKKPDDWTNTTNSQLTVVSAPVSHGTKAVGMYIAGGAGCTTYAKSDFNITTIANSSNVTLTYYGLYASAGNFLVVSGFAAANPWPHCGSPAQAWYMGPQPDYAFISNALRKFQVNTWIQWIVQLNQKQDKASIWSGDSANGTYSTTANNPDITQFSFTDSANSIGSTYYWDDFFVYKGNVYNSTQKSVVTFGGQSQPPIPVAPNYSTFTANLTSTFVGQAISVNSFWNISSTSSNLSHWMIESNFSGSPANTTLTAFPTGTQNNASNTTLSAPNAIGAYYIKMWANSTDNYFNSTNSIIIGVGATANWTRNTISNIFPNASDSLSYSAFWNLTASSTATLSFCKVETNFTGVPVNNSPAFYAGNPINGECNVSLTAPALAGVYYIASWTNSSTGNWNRTSNITILVTASMLTGFVYDSYNLATIDYCRIELRNITTGSILYTAYTNASGFYSISPLVNSSYNFTVRHRDYEIYSANFPAFPSLIYAQDFYLTSRLAGVPGDISGIQNTLISINDSLLGMNITLNNIGGQLSLVAQNQEFILDNLSAMNITLYGLDAALISLSGTVTSIDNNVATMSNLLIVVNATTSSNYELLQSINSSTASIQDNLISMNGTLVSINYTLLVLNSSIASINLSGFSVNTTVNLTPVMDKLDAMNLTLNGILNSIGEFKANFDDFVAQSYEFIDSVRQEIDFIYQRIQSALVIPGI